MWNSETVAGLFQRLRRDIRDRRDFAVGTAQVAGDVRAVHDPAAAYESNAFLFHNLIPPYEYDPIIQTGVASCVLRLYYTTSRKRNKGLSVPYKGRFARN